MQHQFEFVVSLMLKHNEELVDSSLIFFLKEGIFGSKKQGLTLFVSFFFGWVLQACYLNKVEFDFQWFILNKCLAQKENKNLSKTLFLKKKNR